MRDAVTFRLARGGAPRELLELSGFQVDAVGEGVGALRLANETSPQVALVDVGLPGMSGYDVARAIRQDLGARVYLAAVTGYGQPEDRARSKQASIRTLRSPSTSTR